MTATELESVLRTEIGRLNTALSELRGEFKESVANLQTENKVLKRLFRCPPVRPEGPLLPAQAVRPG